MVADNSPDSKTQIQRYIRLTELIPPLLNLVDEGRIALRPAVELSYLKRDEQKMLLEAIEYTQCTPSHAQAIRLRAFSLDGTLGPHVIENILNEEKPNQKERISIRYDDARKYIPSSVPYNKTGEYIMKALNSTKSTRTGRRRIATAGRRKESGSSEHPPSHSPLEY